MKQNYEQGRLRKIHNEKRDKDFFPELAESEDERIRREILSLIQYTKGRKIGYEPRIHQDKMIAWLEKQGEPKQEENDQKSEPNETDNRNQVRP